MTITLFTPDGVAITAQQDRQAHSALFGGGAGRPLGGRSGFRADTASSVLTVTSTTWTLNPCSAMIDPGASAYQGMYGWATDAVLTGSITAADAANPRKDILYILVNDSSAGDGSGAINANVVYTAGTPAATPTAPTLPARAFLVGTISVPKAGGGAPTVALNPARFVAAGATLPVYSQAERDALVKYDGLAVRRMDQARRQTEVWDGTTWQLDGRGGLAVAMWGDTGTLSVGAGVSFNTATVTFPAGLFTSPPSVVVTLGSNVGANAAKTLISAYSITTSGFTLKMQTSDSANYGVSYNLNYQWVAVQSA